jgi:hypothetical protein
MIPQETRFLDQKIFLKGSQKVEICSDGNLEVTFKKAFTRRQFKISLWAVLPNPERFLHRQGGDLIGMIFFALLTLGLIIPMFVSKDSGMVIVLGFPALLFGILSGSCLWRWKNGSTNILAFNLRGGGQIHLWFGNPNQQAFDSFCDTLLRKADKAWVEREIEPSTQSFAGELVALKKLKDSGVLDESEFARAKSKLLGNSEERRIGFA